MANFKDANTTKSTVNSINQDVLDEDFQNYLDIAKGYVKGLLRLEDRIICGKYLKKCCDLKSENTAIKLNRNRFFKYFLKMLETAHSNQMRMDFLDQQIEVTPENQTTSHFSDNGRTYVSVKHLSGYGTLVYMATSSDNEWDLSGFGESKFE